MNLNYYIKYCIRYVLRFFIVFFIGFCFSSILKVNASVISYTEFSTNIFMPVAANQSLDLTFNNSFVNSGNGYLLFNYVAAGNDGADIKEFVVSGGGTLTQCDIVRNSQHSYHTTGYTTITYGSVMCPVNFGNIGLYHIYIQNNSTLALTSLSLSPRVTYVQDGKYDIINSINSLGLSDILYQLTEISRKNDLSIQELQSIKLTIDIISRNTDTLVQNINTQIQQQIQTNQKLDDVNNSINDDTPISNEDLSSEQTTWNNNNHSDNVISDIVLMPITFARSMLNGVNSSCSTFNIGTVFDTPISFPCIDLRDYLGSVLYNLIDILLNIFIINV